MTRDPRTACPTVPELEASLLGGSPSPAIASHLNACPQCAELATEIVSNHAFLAELHGRLGAGVTVPLKAPPVPADLVPGYELKRRIGRGGQGEVYEGIQLATRRRVAVKIVHVGEHDARSRRFEREVELASSLRHAGIVSVLHCERLRDTRCALIMEFIDGVPIDEWAASLSTKQAGGSPREWVRAKLRALSLVAEALQYAHAHGVVHRDLKPENILVLPDGEVRIVDFGVAKRAHDLARATLTGGFSGTLAYAAPEQLSAADERVDIRTDIYSLGVVMYEVLAGRRPFDSHRPLDVVVRDVIESAPPPLGRALPQSWPARADIEAVVAKALAKRPEARYQSAAAMQEDIGCLITGRPVSARLPGTIETLRSLASRHRLAFGLASVSVALLCVIAVSMTWASVRLSSQKERLAEALFVSNIERGRADSSAGNLVRSEEQLWPELIASGTDPVSDSLLFEGSPQQTQAAWALAELYARVPSVLSQRVPPGSLTVGFAQDGETLRVVHPDGTDRTVSLRDGSWTQHATGIEGASELRVSSSGHHVIVPTPTGHLLREAGGEILASLDHTVIQGSQVWDVSSDGTRMLIVTPQSEAELWSVSPPREVALLATAGFTSLSFSLKGDRVLLGRVDGIHAWASSTGLPCGDWALPADLVSQAVTPAIKAVRTDAIGQIIAASFHSDVLLFDPHSGALRTRLSPAHRGAVAGISLTSDGRRVASRGFDQTVNLWDTGTSEHLARFEYGGAAIWSVTLSDDGRRIATCEESGVLRVVDVVPTGARRRLGAAQNTVHRVRYSPDGALVASASSDGAVQAWRTADDTLAWSSDGEAPLSALAFHPSGSRLAVAAHSGPIEVLDLNASPIGPRVHFADAPPFVTWIGYSPDGRLLVALSGEPWCQLIDGETGQSLGRLEGHAGRVIDAAFSRDGAVLYTVGADGELIAWDIAKRRVIFRSGPCGVMMRAVAISPDGGTIATGSDDRIIRLWDSTNGALRKTIHGCRQHIFEMAFHPDGNVMFSCGRDPSVQVWDVRSGRELAVLDGHRDMVMSLALSPDGSTLVTTGADRQVLKWDFVMLARAISANAGPWMQQR